MNAIAKKVIVDIKEIRQFLYPDPHIMVGHGSLHKCAGSLQDPASNHHGGWRANVAVEQNPERFICLSVIAVKE
jgi:hypothetical protein